MIAHIFLLEETMKTHLFKLMILFTVVALVLSACSQKGNATSTSAPAAPKATEPVKVAPTEKPTEVKAPDTAIPPTSAEKPVAAKATDTAVPPTATLVPPTDTAVPPTPTEVPPAGPKVATFIWTQEFDTLNPLYTNMWFSSITQQIWNCWAWDFDDVGNPHAVMVKEIPSFENGGMSADGKVITIKLRDDLVWSDGEPITAEDFIFTYQMTIDPKNSVSTTHPYELIQKIEAPDPHTVVVTFIDPFASWLYALWHGILPKHILQPVYDAEGSINSAAWNREPKVSCGPYVFDKWESGGYARFKASDNYWLGKPKIEEINFRFVPDDASQIAALINAEGDLGTFPSWSDIPKLQEAGIQVVNVFSGYNEGLYFYLDPNKGHPALQDVRVRQAIAYATDRFSLCKDLLLGLTVPAATDYDNTPYIDPSIKPYPFDPEKAKQLLDEAGWIDANGDGVREKDGVDLELTYGTSTREIRQDTQAVFQQQLSEVGISVLTANYTSSLYFYGYDKNGPAATGQLDMFEYSASPASPPDPDVAEWLCDQIPSDEVPEGTNWSAVCDPELDKLFKLQITQIDFAQRQQTFFKITKLIFDKAYWIGFWQDPDQWMIGERLINAKISANSPFSSIMDWDLKP
jgi:peptide/nickel transport system substrate-binding protein